MQNLMYLNPNSTQTLREGIQELRIYQGAIHDVSENVALDLADDIDMHDAIHVLFGCPTSLFGEIIAHVWTAFGTTVKRQEMHRVSRHDDHRKILSNIGYRRLIATWLIHFPSILKTFINAMRMQLRWPAEDFILFLDQRLCDLRENFGICPLTLPSRPGG